MKELNKVPWCLKSSWSCSKTVDVKEKLKKDIMDQNIILKVPATSEDGMAWHGM
jgi:hypothetical protein